MQFNAGMVAKGVVRFVASAGAGAVVSNVIRHNTPKDLGVVGKTFVMIGDVVVSGVIADMAADYVIKQIEEFKVAKEDLQLTEESSEKTIDE